MDLTVPDAVSLYSYVGEQTQNQETAFEVFDTQYKKCKGKFYNATYYLLNFSDSSRT